MSDKQQKTFEDLMRFAEGGGRSISADLSKGKTLLNNAEGADLIRAKGAWSKKIQDERMNKANITKDHGV
jgi:hypothetical protein